MFALTAEMTASRDDNCAFAGAAIAQAADEMDRSGEIPSAVYAKLAATDWMRRIAIPGDEPLRFLARAIIIEEIRYVRAAISMIGMVKDLGCMPVQLSSSKAQKCQVPGVVAAEAIVSACGLTEPQAGSDVAARCLECWM